MSADLSDATQVVAQEVPPAAVEHAAPVEASVASAPVAEQAPVITTEASAPVEHPGVENLGPGTQASDQAAPAAPAAPAAQPAAEQPVATSQAPVVSQAELDAAAARHAAAVQASTHAAPVEAAPATQGETAAAQTADAAPPAVASSQPSQPAGAAEQAPPQPSFHEIASKDHLPSFGMSDLRGIVKHVGRVGYQLDAVLQKLGYSQPAQAFITAIAELGALPALDCPEIGVAMADHALKVLALWLPLQPSAANSDGGPLSLVSRFQADQRAKGILGEWVFRLAHKHGIAYMHVAPDSLSAVANGQDVQTLKVLGFGWQDAVPVVQAVVELVLASRA
ncbi:MAG TPA: hypothetical protein VG713_18010 [Pirellulales bacterium]|nr:hypothetical protein [Pirellulales bacterium]